MAKSLSFSNTRIVWLAAISFVLVILLYISSSPHITTKLSSIASLSHAAGHPARPTTLSDTRSKYAYVTLLGRDALHNETDINDDMYFASMRTLGWSLLHAKESKTAGISFVVLAVPGVNPEKTARLEKDGAIVVHVEPVAIPDWLPVNVHREWQDCWAKLRLFELEQFEKVLFLDADIIVAGRLDVVFETALIQESIKDQAVEVDYPTTIPPEYVFCAGIETSVDHHFPPIEKELEKGQYINAGVFVTKPSIAMLDHYMSVLNTPNSFEPMALEQNLLNQVHRKDGPMPFQQLPWQYHAYRPTQQDVDAGALSYHAKVSLISSIDHRTLTRISSGRSITRS